MARFMMTVHNVDSLKCKNKKRMERPSKQADD